MILDIDLGNTRAKWRCAGASPDRGSAPVGADLTAQLAAIDPLPSRIRLASVASPSLLAELTESLGALFSVKPEVCSVRPAVLGFTTRYRDIGRLGVDRWLAALAAWHRHQRACVVVDAGTALTVDLVSADGVHLGGYIVPGFGVAVRALGEATGAVQVDLASVEALTPGLDTSEAVNHGLVQLYIGMLQRAAAGLGDEPCLCLSGGDAWRLHRFMPEAVLEADLVFEGLALACP